jgi:hypothetical protein
MKAATDTDADINIVNIRKNTGTVIVKSSARLENTGNTRRKGNVVVLNTVITNLLQYMCLFLPLPTGENQALSSTGR